MIRSIRFPAISAIFILTLGAIGCAEAQQGGVTPSASTAKVDLDPAEFKSAMNKGGVQLIDVRTPGEYAAGHIPGNTNLDWTSPAHEELFATLDPSRPVLLYCRSGGRSGQAMEYLKGKGFKDVRHLQGGILAWERAGMPIVKP